MGLSPVFRKAGILGLAASLVGAAAYDVNVVAVPLFLMLIALLFWPEPQRTPFETLSDPPAASTNPPALEAVLDGIAIPILVLDSGGIVLHTNAAARQAFPGCRTDLPVSAGLRAPDLLAAIKAVMDDGTPRAVEFTERIPVERSYAIRIRQLSGSRWGAAPRLVLQAIDTSEQRHIERMRVDFIANASHELRTPLASLLGFVETLQGPARDDPAARTKFLGIMREQAERMRRLIDDLLSLSRIEMRAHVPPSEAVNLAILVPQIGDSLAAFATEKGVTLALDGFSGVQAQVIGDQDELFRAFENLIENAIKYGASGKKVEITLLAVPQREEWTVTVRDFGPGIAAHHLPRLTERFYRADVQESRVLGGTGLGLALVKHIVSRHRGRLVIESAEGAGATFSIVLPKA